MNTALNKTPVQATINGEPRVFLCAPGQVLAETLRDELQLTGTKIGCNTGDCGACSVLVNDRLVCSCLVLAVEVERSLTYVSLKGPVTGDGFEMRIGTWADEEQFKEVVGGLIVGLNEHGRGVESACYLLKAASGEVYFGESGKADERLERHNRPTAQRTRPTHGLEWARVATVVGFNSAQERRRFEGLVHQEAAVQGALGVDGYLEVCMRLIAEPAFSHLCVQCEVSREWG